MATENQSYGLTFAVLTLLILFIGSKGVPGTQSILDGFSGTFQGTPGLIMFGVFMFLLVIVLFIPKEK